MSMKAAAVGVLVWLAANTALAAGAAGGFGEALQNIGRQQQDADAQEDAIRLQHKLEMERMRYEYEMQRQAQERAQAEQARSAQRAPESPDVERQMQAAHPGWRQLVKTGAFAEWKARQPQSVQALGASNQVSDAALMLDLFKRDTPGWQTAK